MPDFESWPKIELHRHVEGSVRLDTFIELARQSRLALPTSKREEIKRLVQLTKEDTGNFKGFIRTFTYLRRVIADKEAFLRVTLEAIEDAAKENIRYLELRFNPGALLKNGIPKEDIRDAVRQALREGERKNGIRVGIIGIVGRDMDEAWFSRAADFCIDNAGDGIVGMDLAGNETTPPGPFAPYFEKARQAGLFVTCHAGELAGPENIINSVICLGARRIGHAARVFQSREAVRCLKDNNVMVEACLTSNVQTGAVEALAQHPLSKLYRQGIPVSINTDDPAVSGGLTLAGEYRLAHEQLGLSEENLQTIITGTLDYIFRPELKSELKKEFI